MQMFSRHRREGEGGGYCKISFVPNGILPLKYDVLNSKIKSVCTIDICQWFARNFNPNTKTTDLGLEPLSPKTSLDHL